MKQTLVAAMFIPLCGIWKYGGKPVVFTGFTQGRTVAMALAMLPNGNHGMWVVDLSGYVCVDFRNLFLMYSSVPNLHSVMLLR